MRQPQAISGLGGIGKTQVVLEYAYRHAQDYQAVFWVRADGRQRLVTSTHRLANRIEVNALDPDAAAPLVLRRAGLLALDAPLTQAEHADWQAAEDLSRRLGGLPLALDQAGAYLEETQCSLQHYLDLYQSHRADLLHRRGGLALDHPDSVATTWSLSFASVEQRNALAADVLRVCSLLHPDAMPEELFLQGAAHLGPALAAIETDPLAFNNALAVIQSYSLLRRSSREQMLSMHRLVQAVLADAMSKQERDQWTERAIAALNALFPEVRHQVWGQWDQCGRLLPHVLTVAAATATQQLELACLLTKTADYLLQRAQYQQAEPLYQRALSICEQVLGNEHPQIAFPLNGLADLYREQGHYEQAEPLYRRALAIRQQQRGARHPETAETLHDFACLHELRNQPEEALALYQQALAIREQRLGPDHPCTLDTRTRYAHLLRACGRTEEAAALEAATTRQFTAGDQEPLRL